jgi:tricorn protease
MMRTSLALTVLLLSGPLVRGQGEARLLRFPAIHGNQAVFTYAGNLYTVPATGGVARKLTSHEGFEMFARFSPDGKRIAFTGQYDGNTEVYVMPAEGGVPKRLTFTATLGRDDVSDRMGPNNIVIAWKDNDDIIFRSRMIEPNDFIGQLFLVSAKGGLPRQLPLPRGGFCSFSPDGSKLAYNRVFREFRTWKRYRGGMADDIWVYDFATKKLDNITKNPAQDIIPMWAGNRIYFLSDRDENKRMNLYVYDRDTGTTRQLTQFTDFDIRFPSLGDKAIVFEYAGYIYRFDLATEKSAKVPIRILEDFAESRTALRDVSKNIAAYEIAPDGKRALFGARGDLFTVPAKSGPTRNLTATPAVHERNPKWSPDGRHIAYISDASGEDEIHILPQDGRGPSRQITTMGPPYKYALYWSPDSKKILWADKKMRLFYVDVESKAVKRVAEAEAWEIRQYTWSPDSKWIAYARPEMRTMQKVLLYSLEQDKSIAVTDGWYDSYAPAFSSDGKYLFFVSERDFDPVYSASEWNHAYVDMARIYFVTLDKNTPSPFKPKSDEVNSGDDDKKPKDKKDTKDTKPKKKEVQLRVDADGLQERILRLPVQPASYRALASAGDLVYYIREGRKDAKPQLLMYDLKEKKETELGQVDGYELSADLQKMLVKQDSSYAIIDLPKSSLSLKDKLNLSGMQVQLDRHEEWKQIFRESWRQMRDYFFDPNLGGVDWPAVRKRYEPLIEHVHHRADLTYVIGDMIGELNAGHTYVGGGDLPKPRRIQTGLLGAQLVQDDKTRYYKITRILKGSNWDPHLRSPLAEVGLNIQMGDYILAVDGQPTNEMVNIYEALVNTPGKQVKLKVNGQPMDKGSREVTVVPIDDEHPLYYYNWVQGNIKKVNDATKDQVGYIHVPDMGKTGLNEFAKHFYPQLRKKALIIDVRGNGGGNVSPMLIERLRREIAMINISRDTRPQPNPYGMLYGPKVCLINEFSASDGDLFPYRFRKHKLGKLIGKRTWGGVIGIRGTLPFLDGGFLNKPEFASYDVEGKKWIIEGHGVDPDIVVDNDPAQEYAGVDQQLNRAIEVILEELRANPPMLPGPPPYPKR